MGDDKRYRGYSGAFTKEPPKTNNKNGGKKH